MKRMEMGSEFWEKGIPGTIENDGNMETAYLLSGRTALDFIIRDIKAGRRFKKAMLPSYCCDSMIEPFMRNDMEVRFYSVTQDGIYYPENDMDVLLLIDYFGYGSSKNRDIAITERNAGKTVIYDATHKINELGFPADYVFCSYRKWAYCNFASAHKRNGNFLIKQPDSVNRAYMEMREQAADEKTSYMLGAKADKRRFLEEFAKAETLLETDYVGYAGMPERINVNELIKTRKRNAKYLVSRLQDIKGIHLWKTQIGEEDAPLFVPMLVSNGYRDYLRKYLTDHQIYCPVHWPVSSYHQGLSECEKEIYGQELSLICDQRYSLKDMEREAKVIRGFFEEIQGCH